MAPPYKLTYFDAKGRGEVIRYLFKYGNIEFEDIRIKREDWPKFKETTLFGQVPLLEYNGKTVNQSAAIARYVAKKVKLAGNDDWENLEIDAIVDTIGDFRQKITPYFIEKDEDKKKLLKETALNETIPYYFSRLDDQVKKNNGYLALGRLTWADFYFATAAPTINALFGGTILDKFSNLKALVDKVEALPAVQKWIDERPKTEF